MGRHTNHSKNLPWGATRLYQEGLAALEQGRYSDAIERLSRIRGGGNLPGTLASFYLGQAHARFGIEELRAGRYGSAAKHLTEAREINPESGGLSKYLVRCFVGQRRFDLAAVELEKEPARHQNESEQPIRLAHALARDGQIDRAVETLAKAIDGEPARADLQFQLGILLASTDDIPAAAETLQSAAELAPWDVDILQYLGLALGALKRPADAAKRLAVAQRLRPGDAHIALLLTLAVEAAEHSGIPTSVDPLPAEETSADNTSIEALGELIIEEPDFVEAFLSLPDSKMDSRVFAMLAVTLERALEHHPEYADLHHHCSRIYDRLGRTDDAISAARRAVDVNPRYVDALIQLGRLYAETRRDSEAIEPLETAIERGGDYPDVHYMLANLYRTTGDDRRACVEYVRAIKRNSNYERAHRALAEFMTA